MGTVTVTSLCWTLLSVCLLEFTSAVPENITRSPGQEAILECKGVKKGDFTVVKWTKSGLKDKYVFLQVDSHIESENQHPSFKNWVDLQDRQMKDGDVSLILKNVTSDDEGTYECHVKTQTNHRKRANLESICTINLVVVAPPGPTEGSTEDEEEEEGGEEEGGEEEGGEEDGGKEDGGKEDGVSRGRPGLIAGICVAVMFLLVVVMSVIVIVLSKTLKKKKSALPAPPDKEVEQQLV